LRNKTDAEIDTAIETTYASDLAAAAGKRVQVERVKDDNEKMSVTIRITTEAGKSDFGDVTVAGGRVSTVTQRGWAVEEEEIPDYSALPTGTQGRIDVQRREDGLFDYTGVKTSMTAGSEYIALADQTTYSGFHIDPATGACSTPDGAKSWTAFKAWLGDQMGNTMTAHWTTSS